PVIHATELNAGRVIASLSTFYRVRRADGETGARRAQRAPGKHAVPHLIADRPHACWSWDSVP
ncbi:MAG: IS3 family transposase, partial [Chromatiaceae bacterium]